MNGPDATQVLNEFNAVVDDAYALYLDATTAMFTYVEWFEQRQRETIARLADQGGPKTIEEADKLRFHYGAGDPNKSKEARLQFESTQGELKERNKKNGGNYRKMSRVLIITIYQYWEDYYRQKFAEAVGKSKNDIKHDLLGDIRLFRNDIVHHSNLATAEIQKCKVLKHFATNEEIQLDQDQVLSLVSKLRQALDDLSEEHIGVRVGFSERIGVTGFKYA